MGDENDIDAETAAHDLEKSEIASQRLKENRKNEEEKRTKDVAESSQKHVDADERAQRKLEEQEAAAEKERKKMTELSGKEIAKLHQRVEEEKKAASSQQDIYQAEIDKNEAK